MSEYRDWQVGDKLRCIDNTEWEHKLSTEREYTLAAIGQRWGRIYIGLEETPSRIGCAYQWQARRFRKVQPRKTDISIFTAMLHGERQKVDA